MRSDSTAESLDCVDLNAADKDQLRHSLPGIGPVLADRIVAFREDHGPFASLTDLEKVPGIGPRLAERLSERALVRSSVSAPRIAISPLAPLSSLSFEEGFFGAANTERLSGPAEEGSTGDLDPVVLPRSNPAPSFEPPRRRSVFAAVGVMAVLIGTTAGAWLSQRTAGAATATVDHQVQVLRTEQGKTHEELTRQAEILATSQQTLAAAVERQKEDEARAEARSAHIAKDVADLAERTRQAQARTDAKVFQVDEAMKLIDWVTTKGYAGQVAQGPTVKP